MAGIPRQRQAAFTIIELLVAAVIIAILAGMLIALAGDLRFKAKVAQTAQRMEQVQSALLSLGKEHGSTALHLQRTLPLGGTPLFDLPTADQLRANPALENVTRPDGGAAWHRCWPEAAGKPPQGPLLLAYPWGRKRLFYVRETWYVTPQNLSAKNPDVSTMTADDREAWYRTWQTPEPHVLSELWPRQTIALLRAAGSLPGATETEAVKTFAQRSPAKPWNDAWGNPLVVAYAIYQPPECRIAETTTFSGAKKYAADFYLREALQQYQHNRAIYLTLAAAGPALSPIRFPSGLPDSSTRTKATDWDYDLDNLFAMASEVCMPSTKDSWTETGFDAPPWKGAKVGDRRVSGKRLRALLMAPIEIK